MRGFFIGIAAALLVVAWQPESAAAKQPGWLGVTLATVTPTTRLPKGLSLASGALVLSIVPNGPAASADLRPGDVIQSINGRMITTADALLTYVDELGAGSTVAITRARAGGKATTVSVVLAAKPGAAEQKPRTPAPSGPQNMEPPAAAGEHREAPPPAAPSAPGAPRDGDASRERALDGQPPVVKPMAPRPAFRKARPSDSGGTRALESPEPSATEEKASEIEEAGERPYTTIKVFYATDRNNTGSTDPNTTYGGDRGTLKYGTCDITVPKDHRVGELEAPSYLRLEFSEDPAKHVILSRVAEQTASDFYKDVGARVAASKGSSAFIFVHGYNVTFKDAARRTAQMTYDLKFDGAPVFFSWPSQGSLVGYAVDEANIEYARSDLKAFISEFARTSTANQIYLVAHSMGNRALTGAVVDLFREAPDVRVKIKEIILAAPDIDADVFKRDIAPAIAGQGQAVTLYASSNDWALKASKKFHGYARAGDTGQALTVVPGIATIDSSEVETDFLGHSYFAESTSIIADIFDILSGLTKPDERTHLIAVDAQVGRYWKIPKLAK